MIRKLAEIVAHWELMQSLVVKDLKIRYHGTIFGYLWSLINPFMVMLIYTLVFSIIMRIEMDHYALYLISALLPWTFFSNSLLMGTTAIVGNAHFIQKFYCPKEMFPCAVIASNCIILLLSFLPFLLLLLYFKGSLGWSLIMLLPVVLIHTLFTLGLVLALSSLFVYFRDIKHLMDFLMMLWFFLCPVIYPLSMVPDRFRWIYDYNPMVPILALYRDIFYYLRFPEFSNLAWATVMALAFLLVGWKIFSSLEKSFVKEI